MLSKSSRGIGDGEGFAPFVDVSMITAASSCLDLVVPDPTKHPKATLTWDGIMYCLAAHLL